ncbi:MAG TPA: DEAD/DEAH box helicase [Sutterellaceae bacterium]|nr:DEAD/DEAH box helicase [Sutterellaceae bacterium]
MSLTEKIRTIEAELRSIEQRKNRLLQQLYELKAAQSQSEVSSSFSTLEKLQLFNDLFIGRRDVYARGFLSKKYNKMGYSPACANADNKTLCQRGRIRCLDCPNRVFAQFDLKAIKMHLQGQDGMGRPFIAGLYPLMPDDTCKLLAVDFDSDNYQAESLSFLSICDRYHIPAYLERSRSGNGAHVWFFFKDFVKASAVRKMATLLLEATMAEHSSVTLASFDRLIPNQDTLPEGGFGNLIALPLQRQPRYQGNSVFVDRQFRPFDDQWQYLATVQKISIPDIHRVIDELAQTEKDFSNQTSPLDHLTESQPFEIKPWEPETDNDQWKRIAESQTQALTIIQANGLYFDKRELSPKFKSALCRLASFPNPVFFERQAKRFSTRNIPRFITCYEEKGNYLLIPRGLTDKIIGLFNDYHITYELLDKRSLGTRLDVKFQGTLRPKQRLVANQLLKNETGVLCASTGFGKTVIGLYALAQRGVSTLIITNRKELATQWRISAEIFLDLPRESIGTISSGKVKPSGIVDIATVQTLANQKDWQKEISRYGMIIVDECHHAAARQYESILKHYTSKYVLGLSATPRRRDGHQPIVYMQCGPVRYRVNHKKENHSQPLMHRLCVRPTQFKSTLISDGQKKIRIQNIFKELTLDQNRNALIISDVMNAYREGRFSVVITERREHLEILRQELSEAKQLAVLYGSMKNKERAKEIAKLKSFSKEQGGAVLLATGKLIGEGFDEAKLDTLFLTMPISDRSVLIQYVGRLHRLCDKKTEARVVDYRDCQDPRLEKMFLKREKIYRAIGYQTEKLGETLLI